MSAQEDTNVLERDNQDGDDKDNKDDNNNNNNDNNDKVDESGDAEMKGVETETVEEKEEEIIDDEVLQSSTQDISVRKRLLENDLRIMKSEVQRLTHEKAATNEKIKDNLEKIQNNKYVWPSWGDERG